MKLGSAYSPGESPLIAVTLSTFLPGSGQSRQRRTRMALVMYAVFLGLLAYFCYEIVTTYTSTLEREVENLGDPVFITGGDIAGAVGSALIACVRNPRIIILFVVLPCVHVWSMVDAYLAGSKHR